MSNRITEKCWSPSSLQTVSQMGWFWYALRDRTGHIRDWTAAENAKEARYDFKAKRPKNGILPGYTIQRGPKVADTIAA
jgi:hypothetical protein